ncbi:MAG: hypothetical protein M1839_005230 [Geoglossum umbratile]|nr:MAG: hypothetical protein M1839_005230 [Geoglossum umbratile]
MEVPTESTGKSSVNHQTGYFEHVAALLSARQHPVIIVEEAAMRWMGLPVSSSKNLDLLIKDNELNHILADPLVTGQYERIQQDLSYRGHDPFVNQVPRLRRADNHPFHDLCLSLWSESVYMLAAAGSTVEVPNLFAWNSNLMEDRFDPVAADVISISYRTRLAAGHQILPNILAQNAESSYPVYVPSIPRLIDALLDQQRYRQTHFETYNYESALDTLSSYHLSNLIRYLHLEKPYQREKLIPQLAGRNRADMETRLDKYKRKPLLTSKDFAPSTLR